MKIGAQFLVTGEVVGQRPMSQNRSTLLHISKDPELKGIILRPLSAKLLPPTHAEEKGLIDRDRLYDFSGRSRKPQIELARQLGISKYNPPAGGCILTEPNYARRVKAFISHQGKEAITVEELRLLRLGRHFWPNEHLHVIVGRDESDNQQLENFKNSRWVFEAKDQPGPLVLAKGVQGDEDRKITAGILVKYCKGDSRSTVNVQFFGNGKTGTFYSKPISESSIESWRV